MEPAQKHHMLSAWPPKASLVQHCPYFVWFFFIHLWWGKEDVGLWGVASVFQGWTIPVPPLTHNFLSLGLAVLTKLISVIVLFVIENPIQTDLSMKGG